MELASMLAGEGFTDAPPSVCPVIRDFLRSYNDRIDDERRQDLYACAAVVVGSRSTPCVERERLRLCAEAAHGTQWTWASLLTFPAFPLCRRAAWRAGWALATGRDSGAAQARALVDDLLEVGRDAPHDHDGSSASWEVLAPSAQETLGRETPRPVDGGRITEGSPAPRADAELEPAHTA